MAHFVQGYDMSSLLYSTGVRVCGITSHRGPVELRMELCALESLLSSGAKGISANLFWYIDRYWNGGDVYEIYKTKLYYPQGNITFKD